MHTPGTVVLKKMQTQFDLLGRILAVAVAFVIPISTTLTEIFFYGAAICCILGGNWRDKFCFIFCNRVSLTMLALFLLFIIGCFYTSASFSDSLNILGKYNKLVIALFLLPLLDSDKWRNAGIFAFVGAMIVTLILSYTTYFDWTHFRPDYLSGSIFKDYLEQNLLMAFACYLICWLAMVYKRWRWIMGLIFIFAVYDIFFLNAGRSGYIVFIILYMLFLWQHFRWKGILIGSICLAIFLAATFSFSKIFKERINLVSSNVEQLHQGQANTSVGQRYTFAKNSFELVKRHLIFGTGTGSFAKEYLKINRDPLLKTTNPHNEYLNITVQLGIVGLILFLAIFYFSWRASYFLPISYKFLILATLSAMFVGSFANSWLMDFVPGHLFLYFIMLTLSALPKKDKCVSGRY